MILVFDLDDTLYDESTYVESSFKAVAKYLAIKYMLSEKEVYNNLKQVLKEKGRGSVFDDVLFKYNIYTKTEVKNCIATYRRNRPDIKLLKDAKNCLVRFKTFPKYLLTDGNKMVQSIKIEALDLKPYFKKTILSHNYGIKNAKPSTYIFHKILNWENANPEELVYIGDNPYKDFINLKKEGFKTLRVLRGNFKKIKLSDEFEAHLQVNTLDEINIPLLDKIKKY